MKRKKDIIRRILALAFVCYFIIMTTDSTSAQFLGVESLRGVYVDTSMAEEYGYVTVMNVNREIVTALVTTWLDETDDTVESTKHFISSDRFQFNIPLYEGRNIVTLLTDDSVYENIEDDGKTTYSIISTNTAYVVDIKTEPTGNYVKENGFVFYRRADEAIMYYNNITKDVIGTKDKLSVILKDITNNYTYDLSQSYSSLMTAKKIKPYANIFWYDNNYTFKNKKGVCGDLAVLVASSARSMGIPTKVHLGYATDAGIEGYHAWCEFLINGQWGYFVDPTTLVAKKTHNKDFSVNNFEDTLIDSSLYHSIKFY